MSKDLDRTSADVQDASKKISDNLDEAADVIGQVSRRIFVGAAAMAGAGLATFSATAQTREELIVGRQGNYASDPGPQNQPLIGENPNSNRPPFTDHGSLPPFGISLI